MKITTLNESAYAPAYGIEMAPLGCLPGQGRAASFGRVQPGGETTPHQHDEAEAFVILKGNGEVVVDNVVHGVGPGSVAIFEPFETHTLRNPGSVPLEFLGPADPLLPQSIYPFHRGDDRCDIFVVPIGQDEQGTRYEAIFY